MYDKPNLPYCQLYTHVAIATSVVHFPTLRYRLTARIFF